MNFFVAALPRSRTAWLSVFLSQGRPCLHDGFNGCYSFDEYLDKLGDNGDSSTGLGLIDVNTVFPDAPVLIIHKSDSEFEHCVEWCDSLFGISSRDRLSEFRERLKDINGLHINQSDIDDRLEEIFTYLTGCEWDDRYADLRQFNIQSDPNGIDMAAMGDFLADMV